MWKSNVLQSQKEHRQPPVGEVFLWKKANFDDISEDMETLDQLLASRESPNNISSNDVESMCETFKTTQFNSMEKNISSKLVSKKKNSRPWINTATRRELRKKQNYYQKASGNDEDWAQFRKIVFANTTGTTFLALLAPLLKQTIANPFGTM